MRSFWALSDRRWVVWMSPEGRFYPVKVKGLEPNDFHRYDDRVTFAGQIRLWLLDQERLPECPAWHLKNIDVAGNSTRPYQPT